MVVANFKMPVPETDLLYARDPSLRSSDEWPAFSLTKARVVSQQTGQPVSLLSAHKASPVVLTGRLEEVNDEYSSSSLLAPNPCALFCS